MRSTLLTKILRRVIIRYFGSIRSFFVWLLVIALCVYFLDCCVLTKDRIDSLLAVTPHEVKEASDLRSQLQKLQHLPVLSLPSTTVTHIISSKSPSEKISLPCGLNKTCPSGEYSFLIRSGFERTGLPTICFNGNYIVSPMKKNAKRGLNMVVINDQSLAVEDIRVFDVYQDDVVLLKYLKMGIQDSHLMLVATLDEASYHLSKESRRLLQGFGSSDIEKIKFRDNFVMLGQKYLPKGKAYEKLLPRTKGNEFCSPVEISGCVSVPLAPLLPNSEQENNPESAMASVNCGVKETCARDAFPVHLYTGRENSGFPMICVSGKYVMAKGLNEVGRGLNIVVVNSKTKQVIRVGHFDTFLEDSSNLEIFLEVLGEQDIVLAVAFDEASTKLSDHAKSLFNELGSAMVQNVKFRDNWIFVGQKGISGFAEIEQVESSGNKWPVPIDKKLCVPTSLKGSQIKPDPITHKNDRRREFCKLYDGYGEFCDSTRVDEVLTPAPLSDKALENHVIFQTPIIVLPGLNFNALRMQLETLLMNPGIRPEMVTVMHDENFREPGALAELFNFKQMRLPSSSKYIYLFHKALQSIWTIYTEAKYVIVLEEEVIPTQDFLSFHAQCLSVIESDESLIGVSAWNENGYEKLSTFPSLAYREQTFPGLGFLLKKTFYDKEMDGKLNECCQNRAWNGWLSNKRDKFEMIVPDVSRVYRRPYEGSTGQLDLLQQLFNRPRVTSLDITAKLVNTDDLMKNRYEELLHQLIASSQSLHTSNVDDCLSGRGLGFYIPETVGKSFNIYFEQESLNDERILSALAKCFGLFYAKGYAVRGIHRGLVRFTYRGNIFFLVGSSTDYYKHKPTNYEPVLIKSLHQT